MTLLTVSMTTAATILLTAAPASADTFSPTCIGQVRPCVPADEDDIDEVLRLVGPVSCDSPDLCRDPVYTGVKQRLPH